MPGDSAEEHAAAREFASDPQQARSDELRSLMLGWRHRLEADQVPGLVTEARRKRQRVSQEDMARVTQVSLPWYGSLERGHLDNSYSEEFLDRVAYGLCLNATERRTLYRLALGRDPVAKGSKHPVQISAAEQAFLDTQPWPAWYSDPAWDLLALNAAALRWFPHMSWEQNVMHWVFKYPQSRHQLVDWERVWAPVMLAQMRAAHARMPDHEGLRQVIAETLAVNEFARDLWEHQPQVIEHPDGHQRELLLPGQSERTTVEMVAQIPYRHPQARFVAVIPVGGYIPEDCRAALSASLSS